MVSGTPAALLDSAVAVGQLGLVAFTAWRGSGKLVDDPSDLLTRSVCALLLGVAEVVVGLVALGVVGLLVLPAVLAVEVALAAAALLRLEPVPVAGPPAAGVAGLAVLAGGLLAAGVGVALSLTGPSREFDTVHYHIVDAAFWMHAHSLWTLPFSFPGEGLSAAPSDGELAGLWLMLPTGGDELAYVGNVAFGILAVLGTALLTRELGGTPAVGALAGTATMLAPLVFSGEMHSLLTDLPAVSGVVVAAALAVRAARSPSMRWPLLCGLAAGLGAGSKYVALAPALLTILLLGCAVPSDRRLRAVGIALAGAAPLSVVWYLRNLVATGNPVSPISPSVGGRRLLPSPTSPLDHYSTPMLSHILAGRTGILGTAGHLVWDVVFPAVLLGALGLGAVVLWRRRPLVGLTSGIALLAFGVYLVTPYTGGGPDGLPFLIGSTFRYGLPGLLIAVGVGAAAWPRVGAVVAVAAIAVDVWKIGQGPGFRSDLEVTPGVFAAGLGLWALAVAALLAARQPRLRLPAACLGAALMVAGVAASPALAPVRGGRATTLVERALAASERPGGPVALIDVVDVRDVVLPWADIRLVGVGTGSQGALSAVDDAAGFQRRIDDLQAGVVVVGSTGHAIAPRPHDWLPLAGWELVGRLPGADVYVLRAPGAARRP